MVRDLDQDSLDDDTLTLELGGRRVAWLPVDGATATLSDVRPLLQLLGWSGGAPPPDDELFLPEDRPALAELLGGDGPRTVTLRARGPGDELRYVLMALEAGRGSSLALAHDVTEFMDRAERLAVATAWLRAVCEPSAQCAVVLRIADAERIAPYLIFGPTEAVLGRRPEELYARSFWKIVHPADRGALLKALRGVLATRGAQRLVEVRIRRHADWRLHEMQVADLRGEEPVDGVLLLTRDITERRAFDALTGLPDRRQFLDRVDREMRRQHAGVAVGCAVVVLRLDRFPAVLEALGRSAGDQLLEAIAERLRDLLQRADSVARIGLEEFAVLVEGIADVSRVTALCEVIRASVLEPLSIDEQQVFTTASLGVATWSESFVHPRDILGAAEAALQRAVRQGGGRVEVYDAELQAELRERLEMEAELRFARQRGELELRYQPIIALDDGHLAGFEALLRWQRPGRDVGPADFVPLAEESDSIHGIGRWVLDRACDQAAVWFGLGLQLFVSINVSARQLTGGQLVPAVEQALARTGLPATLLKLEVTETALADKPDEAARTLQALRALGVQVVLDDFGTGYASLSYLHRFPFDTLKIDRSFVQAMGSDAGPAVVPVIVALGRAAGMAVVAEGVEEPEQLAELQRLGCGFAQGFLLSRPVAAEAIPELAKRRDWLTR